MGRTREWGVTKPSGAEGPSLEGGTKAGSLSLNSQSWTPGRWAASLILAGSLKRAPRVVPPLSAQVPCAPPAAMSSCSRVALVTGANKGLGFGIARELCRQFSGDVVLTARDAARGEAAVQQLQGEGLSPRFHQLDIVDLQSIRALRDFLLTEYGGLDVLVNNAGIAFKSKGVGGRRGGVVWNTSSQGGPVLSGIHCSGAPRFWNAGCLPTEVGEIEV